MSVMTSGDEYRVSDDTLSGLKVAKQNPDAKWQDDYATALSFLDGCVPTTSANLLLSTLVYIIRTRVGPINIDAVFYAVRDRGLKIKVITDDYIMIGIRRQWLAEKAGWRRPKHRRLK